MMFAIGMALFCVHISFSILNLIDLKHLYEFIKTKVIIFSNPHMSLSYKLPFFHSH